MNKLTAFLIDEQQAHRKGGLYHKTQVQLAYNSNRIEGSKLTEEQTRYIFETRTIGFKDQEAVPVDDIIETTNHFVAFDYLLRTIEKPLSNEMIKEFHRILKTGTADAQKSYFNVGDWKKLANEVGGRETCRPAEDRNRYHCRISLAFRKNPSLSRRQRQSGTLDSVQRMSSQQHPSFCNRQ